MTPIPSHAGGSKGACAAALRPASAGLHRRKQEQLLSCQQDRGGVAPALPAPCRAGLARLWRSIAIHGVAATYAQRHSRPSCVEIKRQAEMAEGREAAVLQQWVDYCRPRTSALRSLTWKVSFPAVRSLATMSLADPIQPPSVRQADAQLDLPNAALPVAPRICNKSERQIANSGSGESGRLDGSIAPRGVRSAPAK